MHRTEGQYHSSNMFTDGPPGTRVEQNWLNAIQEELANVIEQSGASLLTAGTDTRDQLYAAILSTVRIPRGYIDGLILSNAADADHDITMAVGKCRDSGDNYTINATIPLTKQIDIQWAEGSSQGGFPSGLGAVGNDTWYHVFAIMKTDGTVDCGYDTSLTAANLLAAADAGGEGYTLYRRVGSVLTDGVANIIPFYQIGDVFIWDSPTTDYSLAGTGVNENTATLLTPLGVNVIAEVMLYSTADVLVYARYPSCTDIAISIHGQDIDVSAGEFFRVMTNTSSQIKYKCSANVTLSIGTKQWVDFRGRNL